MGNKNLKSIRIAMTIRINMNINFKKLSIINNELSDGNRTIVMKCEVTAFWIKQNSKIKFYPLVQTEKGGYASF